MKPSIPAVKAAGRLLKVKEVATRLGVSTRTVQTWIGTGRLTPIRLSTRVLRLDEDEVEAWIRRSAAGGNCP